jgi:hypothetical protein
VGDENDNRGKGSFTLIDLFAVITIICALLAFGSIKAMRDREAARKRELGGCCNKQATDGSYLYADENWRQFNVTRNIRHCFGRGPRDDGAGTDPAIGVGFGSYHSAGVQFARADGSVTRLHRDTDLQVRVYLGLADKDDLTPEFDPAAIKTRLEAEPLNPK